MAKDDNQELTILFEKKRAKKKRNGTTYYTLKPLEIVEGKEAIINNTRMLLCKEAKSLGVKSENGTIPAFPFANDPSGLELPVVYGFPQRAEARNSKKFEEQKAEMTEILKDLKNYSIFLVSTGKDEDLELRLYIHDEVKNSTTLVEGQSFDEIYDVLSNPVIEEIQGIVAKKKKVSPANRASIVLPSDYKYSNNIFDEVTKTVRCQDDAVRTIAEIIAKNSRLENPELKSNMLLYGPTGVGKNEIFRVIRNRFDIPVAFEDAREYSEFYSDRDVYEMLVRLIQEAKGDIKKAQRGILVINKINKIASKDDQSEYLEGPAISALTRMMEGQVYNIPAIGGEIQFDTSQLTMAFIETVPDPTKKQTGFSHKELPPHTDLKIGQTGLVGSLANKCDLAVYFNNLEIPDFIEILKTSDKSQLLLYKYILNDIGIDFIYDDKTIEAIANKAKGYKLGAKGIRLVIENALALANYQVFTRNNYSKLIISPEIVEDNRQFILK